MRVLVVGQGGREHALVWKLSQSPKVTKLYCAPGNAGTALEAENVAIQETDHQELLRFCKREKVRLAIVGPEAPLVAGVADVLRSEGIGVFGPSKGAALLEGSKIYCKQLLRKANVPTADFRIFDRIDAVDAYLEAHAKPCVVKADGLAAGKGAVVCQTPEMALAAAKRMLVDREFGDAGAQIIIEEMLDGPEVSLLAVTDGSTILSMEACQDHKRAFDNDQGPNTGGMGAYCPTPLVNPELVAKIESDILIPVVHAMRRDKRPFQGLLYAGLMLTSAGPKVLEFNVRFGDPECQPLLMRLKTDLAELLLAAVEGRLSEVQLEWDPRPAVCVVMASGGYPSMYRKGIPIRGLDEAGEVPDTKVFHAGTRRDGQRIVTNGGRVLGVTALGDTLPEAKDRAYQAVRKIQFADAMFRTDISDKALASS